jgi:hypothetical protein
MDCHKRYNTFRSATGFVDMACLTGVNHNMQDRPCLATRAPQSTITRRDFSGGLAAALGSYAIDSTRPGGAFAQDSAIRPGVLAGFSNVGGNPTVHNIRWSSNETELASGRVFYQGSSPVSAIISFARGVLTAFRNAGPNGNRIHWSPNWDPAHSEGQNLGNGPIVYDGSSPVTAMIPFQRGVLTAFTYAGPNGNRIHWSPDGKNLGGGSIVYDGGSPVTAMIPFRNGIFAAFTRAGQNGNRIHWSPDWNPDRSDGRNLGAGQIVYDGSSPVTAMIAFQQGVLTAFTRAGQNGNRVHWSSDGQNLGGGPVVYDGGSPVTAMVSFRNGVLTAFTFAGSSGNRIHWSSNGQNLGGGPIVYDGISPVVAMATFP